MAEHRRQDGTHACHTPLLSQEPKKAERDTMADIDLHELTNARKVLVGMRHDWIKVIAAGKSGDTENAIKGVIEVQQAIDVIDHTIDELEESEGLDDDEDD
jgi:hypothetical protein